MYDSKQEKKRYLYQNLLQCNMKKSIISQFYIQKSLFNVVDKERLERESSNVLEEEENRSKNQENQVESR